MELRRIIPAVIASAILLGAGVFFSQEMPTEQAFGAPITSFTATMLPIADSSYDVGTSTNAYREGWFDFLCFTGDTCRSTWPTGGSGSSPFGQAWEIVGAYLTPTSTITTLHPLGLITEASSTLQDFTARNATTSRATSTSLAVTSLSSALVQASADGSLVEYAGSSCTNQFIRSLSALGASTCASVANTDLENSSVTVNGTSISLGSSGTITAASSTLLANNNTWTGLNVFSSLLTASNLLVNGSSTLQNFTGLKSTTTNATSTTLAVTGTATSTFANGVNISDGCFSIDNTCLSTSGSGIVGEGTTGQLPYYAADGSTLTATSTLFINTASQILIPAGSVAVPSLSFSNDTNMGLYRNTNGDLRFADAGGDIFKLDVGQGALTLSGSAVGPGYAFLQDGDTGIFNVTNNNLGFATGGFERARISSAGLFGIGTTSPFTLLSVAGNTYLGGNLTATGTALFLSSTTLQNFTGLKSTTTNATSTSLAVTGTATSTFGGGIDISSGCFAIAGNCLSTLSASSTLLSDYNTWSGKNVYSSLLSASSTALFGQGLTAYASSTFQNFTGVFATTTQATTTKFAISSLSSAIALAQADGSLIEYAGTSCTNQFVRSLSALGAATCETVQNTDLANSSITVNGTPIALGASGTITAATSTLLVDNNTWSGLNVFSSLVTGSSGFLANASSTFQNLTFVRATGTAATTTNLGVTSLTSAIVQASADGSLIEYAGTSCTNQFVRSLSAIGAATCASVANTDLENSAITVNGTSISLGASGTITAASSTLLANNNTWSGLNVFSSLVTGTSGFLANASSTFQNFTGVNATTSNATSTTLFSTKAQFTNATSTSLVSTYLQALTSFFLPFSSSLTTTGSGQMGVDTTTGQLRWNDGTNTHVALDEFQSSTFLASSTLSYLSRPGGTTTILLANPRYAATTTSIYCKTTNGTYGIQIGDGTASTTYMTCTTSGTELTSYPNGAFTARENVLVGVGTQTSAADAVTVTITQARQPD